MIRDFLKAAALIIIPAGIWSATRIALDLTDELEYREDCVRKIELEGLTDYVVFSHCNDGASTLTYWRDSPYTKNYTLIDTNNDNMPDILEVEDKEYTRERNPMIFPYADKAWRRYCDSIDCEFLIDEWLKKAAKKA